MYMQYTPTRTHNYLCICLLVSFSSMASILSSIVHDIGFLLMLFCVGLCVCMCGEWVGGWVTCSCTSLFAPDFLLQYKGMGKYISENKFSVNESYMCVWYIVYACAVYVCALCTLRSLALMEPSSCPSSFTTATPLTPYTYNT